MLRVSHITRATLACGLAVSAVLGFPVPVVVILAVTLTVCGTPCFPAALAGLPYLVHPDRLPSANAVISAIDIVGFLLGPALGGVLVAATTLAWTFLADALVLLTAILFVPTELGGGRAAAPARKILADLSTGARLVMATPRVRNAIVSAVAVNLLAGAVSVLVLPMATDQLGGASGSAGLLAAAFGCGGLVGAVLAAWRTGWSVAIVLLLSGVPVALAAPTSRTVVVGGLLATAGAATTLAEVLMVTRIHAGTPDRLMARVFGLFDAAVVGAAAIGAALAPVGLTVLGLAGTLVALGLACPLSALIALRPSATASVPSPA